MFRINTALVGIIMLAGLCCCCGWGGVGGGEDGCHLYPVFFVSFNHGGKTHKELCFSGPGVNSTSMGANCRFEL